MQYVVIGHERRIVDKQQRVLGDALRAALGGTRAQVERLTADAERLEHDLKTTREELEHQRLLAEALEKELIRRAADRPATQERAQQGDADAQPGVAAPAEDVLPGCGPIPAEQVESLRGPSRRDCAIEELSTTGRTRPVVARDVALRYSPICDKAHREAARAALNNVVAGGLAIRLPDGSFLPTRALVPDLGDDPAPSKDPAMPSPRPEQTGVESAA